MASPVVLSKPTLQFCCIQLPCGTEWVFSCRSCNYSPSPTPLFCSIPFLVFLAGEVWGTRVQLRAISFLTFPSACCHSSTWHPNLNLPMPGSPFLPFLSLHPPPLTTDGVSPALGTCQHENQHFVQSSLHGFEINLLKKCSVKRFRIWGQWRALGKEQFWTCPMCRVPCYSGSLQKDLLRGPYLKCCTGRPI